MNSSWSLRECECECERVHAGIAHIAVEQKQNWQATSAITFKYIKRERALAFPLYIWRNLTERLGGKVWKIDASRSFLTFGKFQFLYKSIFVGFFLNFVRLARRARTSSHATLARDIIYLGKDTLRFLLPMRFAAFLARLRFTFV